MEVYEVMLTGELLPGFEEQAVCEAFARLFQVDAARVAALFCGRPVVIKSGLDAAAADKYRLTLERIGVCVRIEPLRLVEAPAATGGGLSVEPRDEYMAAFRHVEAPDFGLAPLGADLQDARPRPQPPQLDLQGLSLAPPGSDLGQLREARPSVQPRTEHLRLLD